MYEGTTIFCGRLFFTDYFPFCMFNPSQSKFLSRAGVAVVGSWAGHYVQSHEFTQATRVLVNDHGRGLTPYWRARERDRRLGRRTCNA